MDENTAKIEVDIEELIAKLQEMADDGYVTVEVTINEEEYFMDSTMSLKALDISREENEDYGEIRCVADEY